jgi:hypothetical protein
VLFLLLLLLLVVVLVLLLVVVVVLLVVVLVVVVVHRCRQQWPAVRAQAQRRRERRSGYDCAVGWTRL